MASSDQMWSQFRRLLLGTVVEILLEEGVAVDFGTMRIHFHGDSEFRVPRLNNYMRFKGELSASLLAPPSEGAGHRLDAALRQTWPELLAVVDIPIGDRLTPDRNHVSVDLDDDALHVHFDLEAD